MESIRLHSFIDVYSCLSLAHQLMEIMQVQFRWTIAWIYRQTNRIIVKCTNTWPYLCILCGRNEIMHVCYSLMHLIIAASTQFSPVYSAILVCLFRCKFCVYTTHTHLLIYLHAHSLSLISRLHWWNSFSLHFGRF